MRARHRSRLGRGLPAQQRFHFLPLPHGQTPLRGLRLFAHDLVTLIENADGVPLNVGRKTRAVPPAMHRALVARDVGCRYPGCTNTRFVDAHHIVHWADGGETSLENLTLLCRQHHRYVHELGYTLERHGKSLRFVSPDRTHIPDIPKPDSWSREHREHALVQAHSRAQLGIDDRTATPRWDGSTPDYEWIVGSLCRRTECHSHSA